MRLILIFGCALMLSSCQYSYDVTVEMVDGSLIFHSSTTGIFPKRGDNEHYLDVDVWGERETYWSIFADLDEPGCRFASPPKFPIKYGVLPHCFKQLVAPKQLPQDTDLEVDTYGRGASGTHYFKIVRSVFNYSDKDVTPRMRNWQQRR